MKKNIWKKTSCLFLSAILLGSAVEAALPMMKAEAAVSKINGVTVFDDFEDSTNSLTLWNNELKQESIVEEEGSNNHYWHSTVKTGLITPKEWAEGDKPTKVSFDVLPTAINEWSADFRNLAVYFLYSEEAYTAMSLTEYGHSSRGTSGNLNLVLVADTDVSTNTQTENHTAKINETGFTMSLQSGSAAVRRSGSSYGHWLQYKDIVLADGYLRIIAEYDWSKWDTDGIVNIKYTMSDADGLDSSGAEKTTSYIWNYQYTYFGSKETKPTTFKVGFQGLAGNVGHIDNVCIDSIVSQANDFRKTYAEVLKLEEYDSRYKSIIKEASEVYHSLDQKTQAQLAEEGVKIAHLVQEVQAEALTEWGGYDDFSDSYKTSLIWKNAGTLSDNISEETVHFTKASDKYSLSSSVWDENNKPLRVSFVAESDAKSTQDMSTSGLRFYLLDSEKAEAVLNIGIFDSKGSSGVFYGPWKNPDDETITGGGDASEFACINATGTLLGAPNNGFANRRGWWLLSTKYAIGNGPVRYTAVYDWSEWDTVNTVNITVTAEDADGVFPSGNVQEPVSATFTYVYSGIMGAKPTGFNVGFENLSGNTTIDDFSVSWDASPQVLGATLSTDSVGKRLPIRFGFDYTFVKEIAVIEDATPVAFGAVLVAGTPGYSTLKQNATTLLDSDDTNNVDGHTLTKNAAQTVKDLPDYYYITISNSDESEHLGERVSAISYVILKKDNIETIYYSKTLVNHSPMSALKAIFDANYLPANTQNNAIISESALERALASYNEGKEGDALATLDTIKSAIKKGKTNETQRTLLKTLHFSLCE